MAGTPNFSAVLSADGKSILVSPLVDTTVSTDVNWLGQTIHLSLTPGAPTATNDSDGKTWTASSPAADGSYTLTRSA